MKRIILLSVLTGLCVSIQAQKRAKKNAQPPTAYAITAAEKGQSKWTEVRLINVTTGDVIKTIFESKQEAQLLNARTGKPVVKKHEAANEFPAKTTITYHVKRDASTSTKKVVDLDAELTEVKAPAPLRTVRKVVVVNAHEISDKPFSTNSAACAYDKKHERLYYTPMGINQLRYIDLKAKTPTIYYFENEPFGALSSRADVPNQVTRMVIGSDGNGYALTNNADHLIRFTTGKNPVITDLGGLIDDATNGKVSIHSSAGYGGDIIADSKNGLYLITANRRVFKIDIESRVATFKGSITGLPKGYSTNGAAVESGTNVIVNSSTSTLGYYKFDLNTLQAVKLSVAEAVHNASDLANNVLVAEKKKKKEDKEDVVITEEVKEPVVPPPAIAERTIPTEAGAQLKLSAYPNPVTNGLVKLSFENHPVGKYELQLVDITGKLVSSKAVNIYNKTQVEDFRLPTMLAGGNYLIKVVGESSKVVSTSKISVQKGF